MGIFPSMSNVWLYIVVFSLLALLGLFGAFMAARRRTKGIWGGCCLIALVALASGYLTGFTFHLNTSAPVSSDRLVYLIPMGPRRPDANIQTALVAVRLRDGHVQWRHPVRTGPWIGYAQYASDERHVYLLEAALNTNSRGYLVTAFDAQSGHQDWQVTSDVGGTLVGVANGRLILEDLATTLVLDASTGQELQRLPVGNTPLARDGVVYACSGVDNDLTITATEEATGRGLWTSPRVYGCALAFTPEVLIAEGDGILTAIRIKDGSLVWKVDEGGRLTSGPITDGKTLFTSATVFPSSASDAYEPGKVVVSARSVSDGSVLWQKSEGGYSVLYYAVDGVVLAAHTGSDGAIVALRGTDGHQLWSFPQTSGSPNVSIVMNGVIVLSQSDSKQIIALDLHTGAMYWQTSL